MSSGAPASDVPDDDEDPEAQEDYDDFKTWLDSQDKRADAPPAPAAAKPAAARKCKFCLRTDDCNLSVFVLVQPPSGGWTPQTVGAICLRSD